MKRIKCAFKLCKRRFRRGWICRYCAKRVCAQHCGSKDGVMATCGDCYLTR